MGETCQAYESCNDYAYWTYFEKIRFSQFLRDDFYETLAIPEHFTRNLKRKLPERVTLKGPSGISWDVDLIMRDNVMFFSHGWKDFVMDNSLDENDFLIFTVNRDSSFDVLMFDGRSLCEKPKSYFLCRCGHNKHGSGCQKEGKIGGSSAEVAPPSPKTVVGDNPSQIPISSDVDSIPVPKAFDAIPSAQPLVPCKESLKMKYCRTRKKNCGSSDKVTLDSLQDSVCGSTPQETTNDDSDDIPIGQSVVAQEIHKKSQKELLFTKPTSTRRSIRNRRLSILAREARATGGMFFKSMENCDSSYKVILDSLQESVGGSSPHKSTNDNSRVIPMGQSVVSQTVDAITLTQPFVPQAASKESPKLCQKKRKSPENSNDVTRDPSEVNVGGSSRRKTTNDESDDMLAGRSIMPQAFDAIPFEQPSVPRATCEESSKQCQAKRETCEISNEVPLSSSHVSVGGSTPQETTNDDFNDIPIGRPFVAQEIHKKPLKKHSFTTPLSVRRSARNRRLSILAREARATAGAANRPIVIDSDERHTPTNKVRYSKLYESNRRPVTLEERKNALQLAEAALTCEGFMMIMKPTHVYKRFFMTIPLGWIKKHLSLENHVIILRVKNNTWCTKFNYINARGFGGLSGGWRNFAVDNNLEESDVCVFEFGSNANANDGILLDVNIFRVVDEVHPLIPV